MKGVGQDFSEFMKEQGLYEEAQKLAAKKVIAAQLKAEMEKQNLSKSEVAKRMHTTRTAVDNALDPTFNTSLSTIQRFASVLGKKVSLTLI
ncbi:Helix-turn-helix domain-containing protein [Treponema bryantii]|uniref:Helix-turn-helix domain-containing protein n=1 Tax=Treponema bryantii TaxID=163 RepID=A0A1I3N520_9SPIR|nr:helix-turn-helix transcriptional regulator [Treponema bryantii]SFJ04434.1 Helix-turn-helix domain-containing protein [Treponema bryantii]